MMKCGILQKPKLTYIGEDGKEHRPVVIHRAILGSSERFMSFLLEETKGNLPLWLAPHQVRVLPISEKFEDYGRKITEELKALGYRVQIDSSNEKIGYRIRNAQLMKIPYMLVVGEKEESTNTISVRNRRKGDLGSMSLDEFKEMFEKELENKQIDRK